MSNFKSGSGDLDFGSDDADTGSEEAPDTSAQQSAETTGQSQNTNQSTESQRASDSEQSTASGGEPSSDTIDAETPMYPYFVRRNNVTDERNVRLEAHVREAVANEEATFRSNLAAALDTNDVSKTDAREFALKFAFKHPEKVAELMREEGFGAI